MGAQSNSSEDAMRALSYNIHKGIGGRDRRYALARVIEVIERENPDLICLQEVDRHVRRSRFDDQPHALATAFSAAAMTYQLNVHLKSGGYGNLLLSRWPLIEHHHLSLRRGQRKPRGAQLAAVDTPEGELTLVHWHLGLAESERAWQIEHLLHHPLFRKMAERPVLMLGDSNDWRNCLAKGSLAAAGLVQFTAPISRFRTFPAWLAMGSLDKAFGRGIHLRHAEVVRTPLAKRASDHLPIVIDFHLA